MLYMPISYLYYLENDFTKLEYLALHGVYSGVVAIFEVPSGYIADVWGRKPALIIGLLFGIFGFSVYSFTGGLWFFLLAEVLLGIGHSMLSGADSAILYDTLLEHKKEKKYIKHEGNITAVGNLSEVAAALFVSVFIFSNYRSYFQLQTVIAFIGLICTFFLREPRTHETKLSGGMKDIINIVKYVFMQNKNLRNITIFSAIIGFSSLSMAWLAQPILEAMQINEKFFGFSWAGLNLIVALGSIMAIPISKNLNYVNGLLYIAIPLSLGFIAISYNISLWTVLPLSIFYFVRGTAHPILKKYINELTSSEKRATVLSMRSLLIRIMFLIAAPILGIITERYSLSTGILLSGVSILIPTLIIVPILIRSHNKEISNSLNI